MAPFSGSIRATKSISNDVSPNWTNPEVPVVATPPPLMDACLESNGEAVRAVFGGGKGSTLFHPLWLRDHCRCPSCFHPKATQRLTNILDFDEVPAISSLKVYPGDTPNNPKLVIEWAADNHMSEFDSSFLYDSAYSPPLAPTVRRPLHLWGSEIAYDPPKFHVEKDGILDTDKGLYALCRAIESAGFVLVSGVDPSPEGTQKVLESICHIRETFYGGLYDFRPDGARGDTAYTTLALKVHTDGSYFHTAPGLQSFHAVEFEGTGGETQLCDGFRAAEVLRACNPEAFKILTETPIQGRYMDTEERYLAEQPWIQLNHRGEVQRITLNNDDRHTLRLSGEMTGKWYSAMRAFAALLYDPANQFQFSLSPGTMVIFNNWRVLHGRSAFSGNRRICGAYQPMDGFKSRLALLESRLQKQSGGHFRDFPL